MSLGMKLQHFILPGHLKDGFRACINSSVHFENCIDSVAYEHRLSPSALSV